MPFEDSEPDPSPEEAAWATALANYREAWAGWATLGSDYTDEESDAVAAVAFPAFDKLLVD